MGASKKFQTVAPWAIASIFTILNLSDCHNKQHMSVAIWASDKLGWASTSKIIRIKNKETPLIITEV